MAWRHDIEIPQHADCVVQFEYVQSDGTPVNLTGYTFEATARIGATDIDFTTTVTSLTGRVKLSIPASVTTNLTPGEGKYDVLMTDPNGGITRWVVGKAIVTEGITT